MRFVFLLLLAASSPKAFPQQINGIYKKQIYLADSLFEMKEYKAAASAYASAFKKNGNKGLVDDRYRAATSYALSDNSDSAFYHLFRISDKGGWNRYEQLMSDSNLISLHNDSRWNKLVNKVRSNKAETDIETKGKGK
jgi:hypothetical protein